jgi:hypothetical protein
VAESTSSPVELGYDGMVLGIDAEGASISLPHVTLHCPEIHAYSHPRQIPKIICVIPTLSSDRERRRCLDPTPKLPDGSVRFAGVVRC